MENGIILSKNKGIRFVCEKDTLSGIKKVADLVRKDINLVLGFEPAAYECSSDDFISNNEEVSVIFGIAGKSAIIDKLGKDGVIDAEGISGKREVYGFVPAIIDGRDYHSRK